MFKKYYQKLFPPKCIHRRKTIQIKEKSKTDHPHDQMYHAKSPLSNATQIMLLNDLLLKIDHIGRNQTHLLKHSLEI